MARHTKDKAKAKGIHSKKGFLYIVTSQTVLKDGVKKSEKIWKATGLKDTPENVKKASEMRAQLLAVDNRKYSIIDRNISISSFTDQILEKKKREVADTTYAAYINRAQRIKAYFGEMKIVEINEKLIEKFLDSLFSDNNLSPRTVKDTKVFMATVMDDAVSDGIIKYNPVKNVRINKNLAAKHTKDKNPDEEFFSYTEAQLFLNRIKDFILYELFYITLFFGLRREEVLGLRWSAVDLKNKIMRICHTVTKGTMINRLNDTKTESSDRFYPLTDEQVDMFVRLKKKEDANRKLFGKDYFDSDYIFKHEDGTLYYPDYPSKSFRKLIKKIPELPQNITFHGLRKSCVSILVHEDMDVKSIQKWVGHRDINTTLKIYAKVKEKEAKMKVSDAMKGIISLKEYKDEQ